MTSSVGIELLSSSARVTSVKSQHSLSVRESRPIDRTPGTPGSDKKIKDTFRCFGFSLNELLGHPSNWVRFVATARLVESVALIVPH